MTLTAVQQQTTPQTTLKISKFEAYRLMIDTKNTGKIFTVTFIKRDGTIRKMNCRLGVKKDLSNNPNKRPQNYNPDEHSLLSVYDMKAKGYRSIRLNTVIRLKIDGVTKEVI